MKKRRRKVPHNKLSKMPSYAPEPPGKLAPLERLTALIERGKALDTMSASERKLLDLLTRTIELEFKLMANRLDETNRRLGRLIEWIDSTQGKTLPSLARFREKHKPSRTRSSTPVRKERKAR